MDIVLKLYLKEYLEAVCDGSKFANEDEFRDNLMNYLFQKKYPSQKKEIKVSSKPGCGKEYWLIDIFVSTLGNKFIPIEVKFKEEDADEILEDIEKIDYRIEHTVSINEGYVILLTDVINSNFEDELEDTAVHPFRYAIWHREAQ